MKKSDFIQKVIVALENLCIEELSECYDLDSYVHKLVNGITVDNDIEWDKEEN